MEGQLKEAFTVLNGIGSTIFNYALFAAAVGTIVMALLELLKALFYARRRFHEYEMRRWLDGRKIDRVLDILRLDGSSGSEPWREFIELVTGGYATKRAVFDQPIEKLMAQIQAATNMALDFPDRYPALFGFLTMRPPLKPATPAGTPLPRSDAELWQSAAKLRGESAISNEMRIGAEARARLQNLVARQLDALQTEVYFRWSRSNQLVATSAAAVLTFLVLFASITVDTPNELAIAIVLSLFAGLVSPFAKDLASGLSSFARSSRA